LKVVLCCGCFDILHIGHLLHLKEAKTYGDELVVALTSDWYASRKGPGRPRFTWEHRAQMLRELRCVDEVIYYEGPLPDDVIRRLKPAVYVKGNDYSVVPEQQLVESFGGKVVFTTAPKWSSSDLVSLV
jgi:rfaE bifunctional protein nucleotidyltransferase chain/domain